MHKIMDQATQANSIFWLCQVVNLIQHIESHGLFLSTLHRVLQERDSISAMRGYSVNNAIPDLNNSMTFSYIPSLSSIFIFLKVRLKHQHWFQTSACPDFNKNLFPD